MANLALRKAANWAIDRPAQVRLLGAYAGKRTSQILVPGIPGVGDVVTRPFGQSNLPAK